MWALTVCMLAPFFEVLDFIACSLSRTQAYLSIMADYVHIHHDSIYHGLDRVYATFVMLRCLMICASMEPRLLCLCAVPLFCFVKGRDAKMMPEPTAWKFWHACWHVSGGLLVCLGNWVIHNGAANELARVTGVSMGGPEFVALAAGGALDEL